MDKEIIATCMTEAFIESNVPASEQKIGVGQLLTLPSDLRVAILESLDGEDSYEIDRRADDYGFRPS